MRKNALFGFALLVIGYSVSQFTLQGQDEKAFGLRVNHQRAPVPTLGGTGTFVDVENDIRNLYVHLQSEMHAESPDAALVAKHSDLRHIVNKLMASERFEKAIAEFELIIKERPETEDATKAAAAVKALKG